MYFGVFYDPMARQDLKPEDRGKTSPVKAAAEKAAQDESRRLLREQAKDFVKWLKEQGAL